MFRKLIIYFNGVSGLDFKKVYCTFDQSEIEASCQTETEFKLIDV